MAAWWTPLRLGREAANEVLTLPDLAFAWPGSVTMICLKHCGHLPVLPKIRENEGEF